MDLFGRLPPELIHQIIFYLADFPDVESIVSASPRVSAVLHARPKLAHDLLRANSITGTPEIQRICYHTAFIDAGLIRCTDLRHYQYACRSMPIGSYAEALCIIKLAARIQRLACACLSLSQENFVTAVGKHPALGELASERAQLVNTSFTWMEEYRVYWALWRLQHYSELRKAAKGRWGWDETSVENLDAYLVWNFIDERLAERMWTVAALLSDLGLEAVYGHYSLQDKPEVLTQYPYSERDFLSQDSEGQESSLAAWTFPRNTPIPFIPLLDLPSPTGHGRSTTKPSSIWIPPPEPGKDADTIIWRLINEYTSTEQEHLGELRLIARVDSSLRRPSYTMADMKPWRRLGIALWDTWRMSGAGLSSLPSPNGVTAPNGVPDTDTDDFLMARVDMHTSLALMVGRPSADWMRAEYLRDSEEEEGREEEEREEEEREEEGEEEGEEE
ncbi:uncharacterized protein DSM5745_05000 [Aspergillus mulundensis]|uniref:F-box domain-containing protein n=1 Tax=Aspergillus mulundensis TaxID=1810919 RepID=A0A3D8S561_9EURO|nr:hypothetical protein DSM5745_05000 [Aspergillus mulundensis]RDW81443.1 hypothetical protein DSM5745_05000 [Aspergillus mulundensis]